jgi:hypothetical protein
MKRLFIVHGMKRSANHAIINWLRAHGRFIFFNNIIPIAPILEGTSLMPAPEDFGAWLRRNLPIRRFPFAFYLAKLAHRKHALIVNLEDHDVSVRPFLNPPGDVTNVLILRDPRNLFSSRIRKASLLNHPAYPMQNGPAMNRVIEMWKRHAREYLGLTHHLQNKVCVYFNSWFISEDYRKSLSMELRLPFTDEGFSKVSSIGGGSSFDGTWRDGNSRWMDVLNRQSHLTESEQAILEDILSDGELAELAQRIELEIAQKPQPAKKLFIEC